MTTEPWPKKGCLSPKPALALLKSSLRSWACPGAPEFSQANLALVLQESQAEREAAVCQAEGLREQGGGRQGPCREQLDGCVVTSRAYASLVFLEGEGK